MSVAGNDADPRVERSRRIVLEAALRQLAEVGYGRFAIDAVARRSGVARSTIYRHWPDKVALVTDAFETLNVQPRPDGAADGAAPSPREHVRALLVHLAEVLRDSIFADCLPALIDGAARDPRVRDVLDRYTRARRQALTDAIRAGVAGGDFPRHVDPDLAATALSGAIVYRRVMTAARFDPAQVDLLIDSILGPAS